MLVRRSTEAECEDAAKKIRLARFQLITDRRMAFFSVVCMGMKPVPLDLVETAATDGRYLFYNPGFISKLTQAQVKGLVCHEVGHVTGFHFDRQGARDMQTWNIAADIKINSGLRDIKIELPPGAQFGDYRHSNMTVEEVYATLPKQKQSEKSKVYGRFADPGGCGSMVAPSDEKGNKVSEAEARARTRETRGLIEEAARMAKAQGSLPQFIERMIKESLDEPLPWGELLRRFVTQYVRVDFTWRRPNKRLIGQGVYTPTVKKEGIGEVVIGVDTSGSINQRMLDNFAKQIQTIVDEAQPDRIRIMYCDARVHQVDTFERGDAIALKMVGGGGTDFRPVFDKVEQMGIEPLCLIYFTDTYGTFPQEPGYPTIWAITTKNKVPFGDTVYIDLGELQ